MSLTPSGQTKSGNATVTSTTDSPTVDFDTDFMLKEDGGFLLKEDGDKIILEPNDLVADGKAGNATVSSVNKS